MPVPYQNLPSTAALVGTAAFALPSYLPDFSSFWPTSPQAADDDGHERLMTNDDLPSQYASFFGDKFYDNKEGIMRRAHPPPGGASLIKEYHQRRAENPSLLQREMARKEARAKARAVAFGAHREERRRQKEEQNRRRAAGGAVGVLGAIGGLLFRRRRRQQSVSALPPTTAAPKSSSPPASTTAPSSVTSPPPSLPSSSPATTPRLPPAAPKGKGKGAVPPPPPKGAGKGLGKKTTTTEASKPLLRRCDLVKCAEDFLHSRGAGDQSTLDAGATDEMIKTCGLTHAGIPPALFSRLNEPIEVRKLGQYCDESIVALASLLRNLAAQWMDFKASDPNSWKMIINSLDANDDREKLSRMLPDTSQVVLPGIDRTIQGKLESKQPSATKTLATLGRSTLLHLASKIGQEFVKLPRHQLGATVESDRAHYSAADNDYMSTLNSRSLPSVDAMAHALKRILSEYGQDVAKNAAKRSALARKSSAGKPPSQSHAHAMTEARVLRMYETLGVHSKGKKGNVKSGPILQSLLMTGKLILKDPPIEQCLRSALESIVKSKRHSLNEHLLALPTRFVDGVLKDIGKEPAPRGTSSPAALPCLDRYVEFLQKALAVLGTDKKVAEADLEGAKARAGDLLGARHEKGLKDAVQAAIASFRVAKAVDEARAAPVQLNDDAEEEGRSSPVVLPNEVVNALTGAEFISELLRVLRNAQ